jgi:hypothetical protein
MTSTMNVKNSVKENSSMIKNLYHDKTSRFIYRAYHYTNPNICNILLRRRFGFKDDSETPTPPDPTHKPGYTLRLYDLKTGEVREVWNQMDSIDYEDSIISNIYLDKQIYIPYNTTLQSDLLYPDDIPINPDITDKYVLAYKYKSCTLIIFENSIYDVSVSPIKILEIDDIDTLQIYESNDFVLIVVDNTYYRYANGTIKPNSFTTNVDNFLVTPYIAIGYDNSPILKAFLYTATSNKCDVVTGSQLVVSNNEFYPSFSSITVGTLSYYKYNSITKEIENISTSADGNCTFLEDLVSLKCSPFLLFSKTVEGVTTYYIDSTVDYIHTDDTTFSNGPSDITVNKTIQRSAILTIDNDTVVLTAGLDEMDRLDFTGGDSSVSILYSSTSDLGIVYNSTKIYRFIYNGTIIIPTSDITINYTPQNIDLSYIDPTNVTFIIHYSDAADQNHFISYQYNLTTKVLTVGNIVTGFSYGKYNKITNNNGVNISLFINRADENSINDQYYISYYINNTFNNIILNDEDNISEYITYNYVVEKGVEYYYIYISNSIYRIDSSDNYSISLFNKNPDFNLYNEYNDNYIGVSETPDERLIIELKCGETLFKLDDSEELLFVEMISNSDGVILTNKNGVAPVGYITLDPTSMTVGKITGTLEIIPHDCVFINPTVTFNGTSIDFTSNSSGTLLITIPTDTPEGIYIIEVTDGGALMSANFRVESDKIFAYEQYLFNFENDQICVNKTDTAPDPDTCMYVVESDYHYKNAYVPPNAYAGNLDYIMYGFTGIGGFRPTDTVVSPVFYTNQDQCLIAFTSGIYKVSDPNTIEDNNPVFDSTFNIKDLMVFIHNSAIKSINIYNGNNPVIHTTFENIELELKHSSKYYNIKATDISSISTYYIFSHLLDNTYTYSAASSHPVKTEVLETSVTSDNKIIWFDGTTLGEFEMQSSNNLRQFASDRCGLWNADPSNNAFVIMILSKNDDQNKFLLPQSFLGNMPDFDAISVSNSDIYAVFTNIDETQPEITTPRIAIWIASDRQSLKFMNLPDSYNIRYAFNNNAQMVTNIHSPYNTYNGCIIVDSAAQPRKLVSFEWNIEIDFDISMTYVCAQGNDDQALFYYRCGVNYQLVYVTTTLTNVGTCTTLGACTLNTNNFHDSDGLTFSNVEILYDEDSGYYYFSYFRKDNTMYYFMGNTLYTIVFDTLLPSATNAFKCFREEKTVIAVYNDTIKYYIDLTIIGAPVCAYDKSATHVLWLESLGGSRLEITDDGTLSYYKKNATGTPTFTQSNIDVANTHIYGDNTIATAGDNEVIGVLIKNGATTYSRT